MATEEPSYYGTFLDIKVHQIILKDHVAITAYHDAVFSNQNYFKNKIVINVGAGTGILSLLCAKAGAKTVYAVEESSSMIPIIVECVKINNFSDIVKVVEGDISASTNFPEMADVIISEWMGSFLLHESTIISFLGARRFLKDDGIMFPYLCNIYASLVEVPEYFKWDIEGMNMHPFGIHLRKGAQKEPQLLEVPSHDVISEPILVHKIECKTVNLEDLNSISKKLVISAKRDGKYQGLCIWFDVVFPQDPSGGVTVLSTGPFDKMTSWMQTVIVFNEEIDLEMGDPVAFCLEFVKMGHSYIIEYTELDPDKMDHPVPCDCNYTKCIVTKAHVGISA